VTEHIGDDLIVIHVLERGIQHPQEEIDPDVTDPPPISGVLAGAGKRVDAVASGSGPVDRQVQTVDVRRAVIVAATFHAPTLDRLAIPALGPLRIDRDRRPLDAIDQFADEQPGRLRQQLGDDLCRLFIGQSCGPVGERSGARLVEAPRVHRFAEHRQPLVDIPGERERAAGPHPGPHQRGAGLLRRELPGVVHPSDTVARTGLPHARLEQRFQEDRSIMAGLTIGSRHHVDGVSSAHAAQWYLREHRRQFRARRHRRQAVRQVYRSVASCTVGGSIHESCHGEHPPSDVHRVYNRQI
jgi:hypothetical protein